MYKVMVSVLLSVCIAVFFLPVSAFAEASDGFTLGGVFYPYGNYSFSQLPPSFQQTLNNVVRDFRNEPSHITIYNPSVQGSTGTGSSGGGGLGVGAAFASVFTAALQGIEFVISASTGGIHDWLVSVVVEPYFSDYSEACETMLDTGLRLINTADYFSDGSAYWPLHSFNGELYGGSDGVLGSVITAKYELGITDTGTKQFQRFIDKYNITSVSQIDIYGNYQLLYSLRDKPLNSDNCFSYAYIKKISGKQPEFEFYGQPLHNPYYNWMGFDKVLDYLEIDNESFSLCQQAGNRSPNLLLSGSLSNMYTPYVYIFHFLTEQDYKDFAWNGDLSLTDNDFTETDGLNLDELSDYEKAAQALAAALGTDLTRIMNEFNVVIDENGKRFLEQMSTGLMYSFDDLISSFNDSLSASNQVAKSIQQLIEALKANQDMSGVKVFLDDICNSLDKIYNNDLTNREFFESISHDIGAWQENIVSLNNTIGDIDVGIGDVNSALEGIKELAQNLADELALENTDEFRKFQKENYTKLVGSSRFNFPLYNQCKYLLDNLFNYNDVIKPPNFDFYMDINKDGVNETYSFIDFSILEYELTNENMADKTWWFVPIKVIDVIRLVLCAVIYSMFIKSLLKRLAGFYGSSPFFLSTGLW